jgi:hypothetical protein
VREINVSCTGDPVHAGDKALMRETPAQRGSVNRYDNNKQFIPRVYMFINHKMTHRYIYFRFTRHALQLHHVTMLNVPTSVVTVHGYYKRLCCQNLAYHQTEIKWSFFVEPYKFVVCWHPRKPRKLVYHE